MEERDVLMGEGGFYCEGSGVRFILPCDFIDKDWRRRKVGSFGRQGWK